MTNGRMTPAILALLIGAAATAGVAQQPAPQEPLPPGQTNKRLGTGKAWLGGRRGGSGSRATGGARRRDRQ